MYICMHLHVCIVQNIIHTHIYTICIAMGYHGIGSVPGLRCDTVTVAMVQFAISTDAFLDGDVSQLCSMTKGCGDVWGLVFIVIVVIYSQTTMEVSNHSLNKIVKNILVKAVVINHRVSFTMGLAILRKRNHVLLTIYD